MDISELKKSSILMGMAISLHIVAIIKKRCRQICRE